MYFLIWAAWQIFQYDALVWLVFIAIAFSSARLLGWRGVPVSGFVFLVILYFLDARQLAEWHTMPDLGWMTFSALFARIIVLSTILSPAFALGAWLKKRKILKTPAGESVP